MYGMCVRQQDRGPHRQTRGIDEDEATRLTRQSHSVRPYAGVVHRTTDREDGGGQPVVGVGFDPPKPGAGHGDRRAGLGEHPARQVGDDAGDQVSGELKAHQCNVSIGAR
jgi:hypothetical protein